MTEILGYIATAFSPGNLLFALIGTVLGILIFASTEGASPPSSAPIFISCSIAEEDDVRVTFKPLVFHYVIPIVLIGILIALGILPIVGG